MNDAELHRIAAGGLNIGLQVGQVIVFKKGLTHFTGRKWSYREVVLLSAMVTTLGSWLGQGQRSEQEIHDAIAGNV